MWHISSLRALIEMLRMKMNSKSIIQACSNEPSTSLRQELNSNSLPRVLATRVVYKGCSAASCFLCVCLCLQEGEPHLLPHRGKRRRWRREKKKTAHSFSKLQPTWVWLREAGFDTASVLVRIHNQHHVTSMSVTAVAPWLASNILLPDFCNTAQMICLTLHSPL